MAADELAKWAEAQTQALMAAGVDGFDAEATIKRVLAAMPDGVDLATWVPVPSGSVEITEAVVDDGRAEFYVVAPSKMARLLDAAEVTPDA